jgi:hypothetical protein
MRIADRVLLHVFALGSIFVTVAMLVLVGISLVAGNLIAASIFGLAFIGFAPLAFYSVVMAPSFRNVRSINMDLGGLDPETYFNVNTAEGASLRHALVRSQGTMPSSRPQHIEADAHSGGQGRRFFSAAEGLSLTDASTPAR